MSQRLSLNVNGKVHSIDVDPDIPLLYALRKPPKKMDFF